MCTLYFVSLYVSHIHSPFYQPWTQQAGSCLATHGHYLYEMGMWRREREKERCSGGLEDVYISQILTYSLTMLLNCKSLLEIIIKCRFLLEHLYRWVLQRSLFSANLSVCNYVNACTSVIRFFVCFVLFLPRKKCVLLACYYYEQVLHCNKQTGLCLFFVLFCFLKALYKALPTLKHNGVFVYAWKPLWPSSRQKARLCKCFNYYF